MAVSYNHTKSSSYGAGAGNADPYFSYDSLSTSGTGTNLSVTSISSCSISNFNTNGSSSNGKWQMDIQVELNGSWYTIGYISVSSQLSTHQTFSSFTSTASASVKSLMGKYSPTGARGKVTSGYFHCNSGSVMKLSATTVADYTKATAPTTLTLAKTSIGPGTATTLSWSGAAPGSANAITGYNVYYSPTAAGTYTLLTSVTTTSTSGSVSVTAPSVKDGTYFYKVRTLGAAGASYYSDYSAASGALIGTYTDPIAPTDITLGGVAGDVYVPAGNMTLTWAGAVAGTNNSVVSYDIMQNGTLLKTVQSTVLSTTVPTAAAGNTYAYSVVAVGTYSNSVASEALTAYTYSNPLAPTVITLSEKTVNPDATVTLSWSGQAAGSYNAITSYDVYVKTTGDYVKLKNVAGTSTTVQASSEGGKTQVYKIVTVGMYTNSALSEASATLLTNTTPTAPIFTIPAATEAVVTSSTPAVLITVAAKSDTTALTLYISTNGEDFVAIQSFTAAGGNATYTLNLTANATNTVAIRVADAAGFVSTDTAITIDVTSPTWSRAIAAGDIIANETISHRTDLNEMCAAINTARAYYGLAALTLPGVVGNWSSWKAQLQAMQTALADCYRAASKSVPTWKSVPVYPTASIINQVRDAVMGV